MTLRAILLGVLLGFALVSVASAYIETTQPLVCDHGPRSEGPWDCSVRIAPGCVQVCDERNGR